jgi:ribonuclease HIII
MTDMTINEDIPKQRSYRERNRQINNSKYQIIDIMRNDMVVSKYSRGKSILQGCGIRKAYEHIAVRAKRTVHDHPMYTACPDVLSTVDETS